MSWKKLEDVSQISALVEESRQKPVLIFKHSSRCSISSMAWSRLERSWKMEDSQKMASYFLDLINYREISNQIADQFKVAHASPQVIIIKNGEAVYDNSHMGISYRDIISIT
ncbi:MAG: bacillithiol system redox-active protein YtxJ [Cyclobacteriaceae bacterium]